MTTPPYARDLPGGWRVSLCPSSNGSAPDRQGGMSTNCSTLWCRLVGNGVDSGWQRVEGERSILKARQWWDAVESVRDVSEAWAALVDAPMDGTP